MAQILLVDDDQDLIEMNRTVLTQRGHKVAAAYSAAEAQTMAAIRIRPIWRCWMS